MSCPCKKSKRKVYCKYAQPTDTRWALNENCYVNRCYNKDKLLSEPPSFYPSIRIATKGDKINGEILPNAEYIAVRSCYCYEDSCPHFTPIT